MDNAITPLKQPKTSSKSETAVRHSDRLIVSAKALERLNGWLTELQAKVKGITVTRNRLADWLICNRPASLSVNESNTIEKQFFDELKFAQWAVKELRAAKARGEQVRLSDIMAQTHGVRSETAPRRARVKKPQSESTENNQSRQALSGREETPISLENSGEK